MPFLTAGTAGPGASVEWGTPDSVFLPLDAVWDFTLDGAASHKNAKVRRYCTADGTWERWAGPVGSSRACNCSTFDIRTDVIGPRPKRPHASTCPLAWRVEELAEGVRAYRFSALDGLEFPWREERVFLNPPWGEDEQPCEEPCAKKRCAARGWHATEYIPGIEPFVRKAKEEAMRNRAIVVAVLPARMDTSWMHDHVLGYASTKFLRGRVHFIDPLAEERIAQGLKPREGPPVGSLIATWR